MLARFAFSAIIAGALASPVANVLQKRQGIPVGSIITTCNVEGTVALTFDDGPFAYTDQVLDTLAEAGIKATFFVCGNNWASIYDYQSTVQRMVAEGHQVGSHTWSHPDLATLSASEIRSEMTQLENALVDILGNFPTYMRHPFFSSSQTSLSTMAELGYHIVHSSIDTKDWENNTPNTIQNSVGIFTEDLDAGGTIALAHEVHQTTASILVPEMIRIVQERGLRAVTVGECLGDSQSNWYRTSR